MKIPFINNAKKITAAILLSALTFGASANNIAVANTRIVGQNAASNYTHVKFDISWENSWRTSTLEGIYMVRIVYDKGYKISKLILE